MSEPSAAVPADPSIVPALLKDLEFGDTEKKHDALVKLTSLSQEDPSFTSDHISPQATELFRILKLPETQADPDHRTSLVRFISSLFYLTDASRAIFAPHVDAIIPYLIPCYTLECLHVQHALSRLAQDDPSSHPTIIASLKSHLYTRPARTTTTPEIALGAVEVYGYTIQNSYAACAELFFKAGAYDATIAALHAPHDAQTRLAALICLRQVYPLAQTASERTPSSGAFTFTPCAITRAVIQRLGDESVEVAFEAMSFLESMSAEDEVRGELSKDPGALRGLVLALARDKPAGSGATGPHWLLARVGDEILVRKAFEGVWKDGKVSMEVKLQIVRGMLGKYVDVRKAAIEAGLCDLLLEEIIQKGGEERSAVLVVLEELVGEAQSAGYYLMQRGCIDPLLDIVEGPSPTDRPLALSILARLLESYGPSPGGPDAEPIAQRPAVAAALTSAAVLPRIMASFHSPTPDGAAHLLAEILTGEFGTKAWDYPPPSSSPPPPSTPYKDLLVTPSLVAHTIDLLRTHTAPKAGLRLLYQCGWGYARGFDLVQAAIKHVIADADVFFLAALCGTCDGLDAMTQGRRVAEAAYLAGALPRAFELLVREEGASDAAHRRAAVEGLRFVLGAPSANKDLGRKNDVLPRVLASLLGDETKASLEAVVWMLRLLESGQDKDKSWLIGWSDFGNEKTVGHLVGLLQRVPYNFDPDGKKAPDSRVLDKAAFDKAAEAYWNNSNESRKLCERLTELVVECINKALPIIAPHSSPLIEPLVVRCHELGGNSAILETLNNLLASSNGTNEPLVAAFKHLLSLPTPPPVHRFGDWVRAGPAFAAGLGEAGLASWLLAIVTLEDELDERYFYRRQALTTLAELVENTTDPARAHNLRKLFFDTDKTVKAGIELATSPDNSYYAPEVKGALGTLVKDYPEGAVCLESEGLSLSIAAPEDPEFQDNPAVAFHDEGPVKLKKKRSRWCFCM